MDLPSSHPHCIIATYETARIAFKNRKDAITAEKSKDLWLLETVLTPDNDTEASHPNSKSRKRAHSPEAEPRENTRIFCQIPWPKGPQVTKEQLEEEFFNHFAHLGVLE